MSLQQQHKSACLCVQLCFYALHFFSCVTFDGHGMGNDCGVAWLILSDDGMKTLLIVNGLKDLILVSNFLCLPN